MIVCCLIIISVLIQDYIDVVLLFALRFVFPHNQKGKLPCALKHTSKFILLLNLFSCTHDSLAWPVRRLYINVILLAIYFIYSNEGVGVFLLLPTFLVDYAFDRVYIESSLCFRQCLHVPMLLKTYIFGFWFYTCVFVHGF